MKYNNWFCEKFRAKTYSQHGEEGVIEELFKRLDITEGMIVECGASTGRWNSNIFTFVENGFNELAIEINKGCVEKLKILAKEFPIIVEGNGVSLDPETGNTLTQILDRNKIDKNFELLNIDIDGWDYCVWFDLENYSPKIVVIEIEPRYDLDKEYLPNLAIPYNPKTRPSNQASFKTMLKLGKEKGYSLAGCLSCNMFFVRDDLIDKLNIPDIIQEPERNFDMVWTKKYEKED